MQNKLEPRVATSGRRAVSCSAALGLTLTLCTTGCLSPLHQHTVALSVATAPVVSGAATAYANAEALHDIRENYDAVDQFDSKSPVYDPRSVKPLMSAREIEVRLTVLQAFQAYTRSLVQITNDADSPELEASSRSAGENLSALGNALAPSVESTSSVGANSTDAASEKSAKAIGSGETTGIQVAVHALAEFLVSRKIKSQLPAMIVRMDPNVEALCKLLEQDLDTLQSQEHLDFDSIIDRQTLFLRTAGMDARHPAVDPGVRRDQIMQLPQIARQQRAVDAQLTDLKAAIVRLALTHHALAAEAQSNNPESLKAKLSDLAAAGSTLGKF